MLEGFLSTTTPQSAWAIRRIPNAPILWTRFRQKPMPQDSVFVNGVFHGGAHMNLMVVTDNPKSSRSEEADARIKAKRADTFKLKRESRAKSKSRSPSRGLSQSKPRWCESDWTGACHWGDSSWSSRDWNNDPSWGSHQWYNGQQ